MIIKLVTPLVLLYLIVAEIWARIQAPYSDLPRGAEFLAGWLLVIGIPIASYFFTKIRSVQEAS